MKNKKQKGKKEKFREAILNTPHTANCYKYGLQAFSKSHRVKITMADSTQCGGSVELDECVKKKFAQENRWDYILGYKGMAFFVEFHSANTGEVSVMSKKLQWLKDWLNNYAPEIIKIKASEGAFVWIQSNGNHILKGSPQERKIAQMGLRPVARLELT